jgi:hypothetical protein
MLARPGSDALAIDPHAAVGGLVEAFEEVLDLGVHLSVVHGVGRWATVEISANRGNAAVCLTELRGEIGPGNPG